MCGTCGCGESSAVRTRGHEPAHRHAHEHEVERRRIAVERSLLEANDGHARALEKRLAELGITGFGLVGGPGSGKTSLLEATLKALGPGAAREAVIEGDCATDRDARRVAASGARVVQIETGSCCHLDAHAVEHALAELELDGVRRLWIENVGNLVCPAAFACGERWRIALVSVTEGDEKPEKYPALFSGVDLLVVSKIDLLPYVDFDVERCVQSARRVHPELPVIALSARSGEGLDVWRAWLEQRSA